MTSGFDPYRTWLSIDSLERPLGHYELLGIDALESEPPVICEAFDRQVAKVSPHLAGRDCALAQRLLNELADAKVVLLTPTTKRAYDSHLRERLKERDRGPAVPIGQLAPTGTAASPAGSVVDDLLPPMAIAAPSMHVQAQALPSVPSASQIPFATLVGYNGPAPALPGHMAVPSAALQGPYGYAPVTPAQSNVAVPVAVSVPPAMAGPSIGQNGFEPRPLAHIGYEAQGYEAEAHRAEPAATSTPLLTEPHATELVKLPQGRPRSSSVRSPYVLHASIGAACVVVVGLAVWATLGGQTELADKSTPRRSAADQDSNDRESATVGALAGSPPVSPATSANTSQSGVDSGSQSVLVAPDADMAAANPASPMTPDDETVKSTTPEPDAVPAPSPKPAPDPAPDAATPPSPEAADPQEVAAVEKAIAVARSALAKRELETAREQLNLAILDVSAVDLQARIDRMLVVSKFVEGFWTAVEESTAKLTETQEFDVSGQTVIVVEVQKDALIVRASGRNRTYTRDNMPVKLAVVLAERWLAPDDPSSPAFVGAFLAVDPKGDRARARQLLEKAAAAGTDVRALLDELQERDEQSHP